MNDKMPEPKDVDVNMFVSKLFDVVERIAVLVSNQDRMAEMMQKFTNDIMQNFGESMKRISMLEQRIAMMSANPFAGGVAPGGLGGRVADPGKEEEPN